MVTESVHCRCEPLPILPDDNWDCVTSADREASAARRAIYYAPKGFLSGDLNAFNAAWCQLKSAVGVHVIAFLRKIKVLP